MCKAVGKVVWMCLPIRLVAQGDYQRGVEGTGNKGYVKRLVEGKGEVREAATGEYVKRYTKERER